MEKAPVQEEYGVRAEVAVINEAGFAEAMIGLSLSYNVKDMNKITYSIAPMLASRDGGHNKFLESIAVWIDMTFARYFWQQFDTYRVGMTKQSESTMHTITKSPLTQGNFATDIPEGLLKILNEKVEEGDLTAVKSWLPESFLQRRIVCTNYKTLKTIMEQRQGHKLAEWKYFIRAILPQLKRPHLIVPQTGMI